MKMIALDRRPNEAVAPFPPALIIPDSALTLPGRPLFVPDFAAAWEARILVGVRVSRLGKGIAARFADRYYDAVTLLLRLVPLPEASSPGALASAFDGCIQLGQWIDVAPSASDHAASSISVASTAPVSESASAAINLSAPLTIDFGSLHFSLTAAELALPKAVEAVSRYLTIRNGDIIAPVTLPAALPASRGDIFTAAVNAIPALKARLK